MVHIKKKNPTALDPSGKCSFIIHSFLSNTSSSQGFWTGGCPSFCCPSWSPVFPIPPPSSSCWFFPGLRFLLSALLTQSMILGRSQQPHGCPSSPICVLSPLPFLGSRPLLEDVSWIPYYVVQPTPQVHQAPNLTQHSSLFPKSPSPPPMFPTLLTTYVTLGRFLKFILPVRAMTRKRQS